ncbi:MAG TPA: YaiO family outer membrane beta-barrel protein [Rubricoccaceae bacterium]|jgi:YaiO family outer membrane protein
MTLRLLLALFLAAAAPASAQAIQAVASHRVEAFRADHDAWTESRGGIQARGPRGALGAEIARVQRNGRADVTGTVDAYRVLSRGLYANVRIEAAPRARVVPAVSALAEVYWGLAPSWEASAGVRYLAVTGPDVPLATASATRVVGQFSLGVRTTAALRPALAVSAAATVRYAPEAAARGVPTRVALVLGQGQEGVVGADGAVTVRRQFVAAVYGQRGLAGPVGVSAGAGYTADGVLTRWSAEAGLVVQL